MSFRTRLRIFFGSIVVLPMAALAIVLVLVSGAAKEGKADASLDSSLVAATAVYDRLASDSAQAAENAADELALAIRDRSPRLRKLVRRHRRAANLAELVVTRPSGRVLARSGSGGRPQRAAVVQSNGEDLGRVVAARSSGPGLAAELARVTGRSVQVIVDGVVAGESGELSGVAPAATGTDELTISGEDFRLVGTRLTEPGSEARIVLAAPTSIGGEEITPPVAAAGLAVFVLAALLFTTALTRALEGQVEVMLDAARRIGEGEFDHRVPVIGDDELAGLAQEFNRMSERLGLQVDELRRQQVELNAAVRRIGELAASGLDRAALLNGIAEAAVTATGADAALVLNAGPGEEGELVGPAPASTHFDALQKAAEEAIETGEPTETRVGGLIAIAHPLPGRKGDPVGAMAVARSEPFEKAGRDVLAYLVGQASVSMENVALHERVAEQAVTDSLTGLANKRHFEEWLVLEVERARRFGHTLSLLILDVDDFKQVNDTRGHRAGDAVLRELARAIELTLREVDLPARWGGEEFVVGLPETDFEGARNAGERIRELVEAARAEDPEGGEPLAVTVSVGASTLPDTAADGGELVSTADAALYEAKRGGKNRVEMCHP